MAITWTLTLFALSTQLYAQEQLDHDYTIGADGIPVITIVADSQVDRMAKTLKGDVDPKDTHFLSSVMNWLSSFFYEADHEPDPNVRRKIIDDQEKYNQDITDRLIEAKAASALKASGAGSSTAQICPAGVPPLKPFNAGPEVQRADASGWILDPEDKRTFHVGATQLGGPKDTTFYQQKGGGTRKAPNTSSYNPDEWVPRGMKKGACEFALPGFVPEGVDVLVRVNGVVIRARRGDTGPMTTHNHYWKTIQEEKARLAKLTTAQQAKIKADDERIARSNRNVSSAIGGGKGPAPRSDPDKVKMKFPMRGMDLSEGCWDQLQAAGAVSPAERNQGWSIVDWQFSPAPNRTPEPGRPQPVWTTVRRSKRETKQYLDVEASSQPWGGKGKFDWWNPNKGLATAERPVRSATPPTDNRVLMKRFLDTR